MSEESLTFDEIVDFHVEATKTDKLSMAISAVEDKIDDADILTMVMFYREGEQVAYITLQPDRDAMLWAAEKGRVLFSADTIVTVFEAYNANTPKNPVTGLDWEPGDMQYLADVLRHESVAPSLTVQVVSSERYVTKTLPYRLNGKEVDWLDWNMGFDTDTDGDNLSGVVPDAFGSFFKKPTLLGILRGEDDVPHGEELREQFHDSQTDFDSWDKVTQEAMTDVAGVRHISSISPRPPMMMVGLGAQQDSLRAQIIDVAFNHAEEAKEFGERTKYYSSDGPILKEHEDQGDEDQGDTAAS